MANTFAPFGFADRAASAGVYTTGGYQDRLISGLNSTQIFAGDPVTSLSTGYITLATPGTTQIAGIFVGCRFLSASLGTTKWLNYWPGNDAAPGTDVTAFVITHNDAVFTVQTGASTGTATPANLSMVGNNVNFANAGGNVATQRSGCYADLTTVGTSATLPFRIISLITAPPGANGTDTTTAFNYVQVIFNNQDFNVLTGI